MISAEELDRLEAMRRSLIADLQGFALAVRMFGLDGVSRGLDDGTLKMGLVAAHEMGSGEPQTDRPALSEKES